jgi:hypothetical protein
MTAHPTNLTRITTGMPQALAISLSDYIANCEDTGELPTMLFMRRTREWEHPDASVGFAGGWIVTATMIGAQIGDLVLSREDAAAALGSLVAWVERDVSERLTESADYDAPMAPSRMEA